jgi:hypothetical protein
MVWLFYAVRAHHSGRLRLALTPGRQHVNFAWRSPRETLDVCQRPVHLDLGPSDQASGRHLVLRLNRSYPGPNRLLGSGTLYTAEAFHNWMAHGIPLTPWIPDNSSESTTDDAEAA